MTDLPARPFLYAVLDRSVVPSETLKEVSGKLVRGGAGMIQYRAKSLAREEMLDDMTVILKSSSGSGIPVIVNDDPALAAESGADGVHLGEDDPAPLEARKMLGNEAIIGVTIHSIPELSRAGLESIDYVSVGSVFASPTKESVDVVGTDFIKQVRKRVDLTLVAIGGITPENVERVLEAGADGFAVISSLYRGDLSRNLFTFREIVAKRLENRP